MPGFDTGFGFGLHPHRRKSPALPLPATFASIVAFGDSITAGVNASVTANRWANLVATAKSATLLNQGIPGTVMQNSPDSTGQPRASNGRDRYVTDITGTNKRAFCIIAYGFNDLRYTGAPATFNTANLLNDYREVLNGLLTLGYTQADICMVSPHWISDVGLNSGSAGFTGQTRAGFEAGVAGVKALAQEFGVYYADSYSAMRDNGGSSLIDPADNIHPLDNGHAVIAAAVLAATRVPTALPADTTPPTITSSATQSVVEANAFSMNLTANETVTWTKTGGADASLFTLTGSTLSMTAKTFASPVDSDANNTYVVQVTATDTAGNATNQTITVTVTVAQSTFVNDTFTDTNGVAITSHTAEQGGPWVVQSGYVPGTPSAIQNNRLYSPTGSGVYHASGTPPTADYYVEATLTWVSTVSLENIGVAGRMAAAANTLYFARWSGSVNSWQLFKTVAGTSTQLGSNVADTFTSGTKVLRLSMVGSTISVSVNGTQIISVTDTAITAAGSPGIRAGNAQSTTTGIHVEDFKAAAL
jgi:lysophospholipase L1-like esterase